MKPSKRVIYVATQNNISPQELADMIRKSAIVTSQHGNRKYHNWWFVTTASEVLSMVTGPPVKLGNNRGKGYMGEDHDVCEGRGCKECNWTGEAIRPL